MGWEGEEVAVEKGETAKVDVIILWKEGQLFFVDGKL